MDSLQWKIIKTWPHSQNLQKSILEMNKEQVDLNIIEISLTSLHNDHILEWILSKMKQVEFYLKYRFVLEKVINGQLNEAQKKNLITLQAKFDENFIQGDIQAELEFKDQKFNEFNKEKRLNIMCVMQNLCQTLNEMSITIFGLANEDDKQQIFANKLEQLSNLLSKKNNVQDQPYLFKNKQLQRISKINIKNSYYIKTKNRIPFVIDFEFARYLYKNDNQLSHQIIACEFIKYLNKMLGKEYIKEYEVFPQKDGAFYQFVQNSATIDQIKKKYPGGLVQYYKQISLKSSSETILNKFAETYSGFCFAQYVLDIKDRNNANIMIGEDGSIFHIDLAFIFESSPGGISFQSAPFKMTKQNLQIMGGFDSDYFRKFQALLVQHFTKLYQSREQLLWKIEILSNKQKEIRCFKDFRLQNFRKKIPQNLQKTKKFVQDLIDRSYDCWKTKKYDDYQFKHNNIEK